MPVRNGSFVLMVASQVVLSSKRRVVGLDDCTI